MSVFHIYGSHKNGCFGLALRASLVGSQPGSAPQWVGAWLPSRRPPHPDPTWNSSWYSPLSLLLLLIHRFNLEILLPLHQARLQRVLLACHHHHQHLRMEMVSTLGSLAFSSRSRNQSQCGDQSLNSKAIGQQTPVAEEGDKHWRRRKRPTQTQGRHCFNLHVICADMWENFSQVFLQAEAEAKAGVGELHMRQEEAASRWGGRISIRQHQVGARTSKKHYEKISSRFFGLFKPKPKPRPVSRPHCGSCCYASSSSSSSSSHHHQSSKPVQSNSNHQSSSGGGCRCIAIEKFRLELCSAVFHVYVTHIKN